VIFMRTLRKNQQKLYYSNLIGTAPNYALDDDGNRIVDYVDEEGNIYYREEGDEILYYSTPQEFFANIAMSGGEAEAVEYGFSTEAYQAVMVLDKFLNKSSVPLKEGSLIWHTSPVENEYGGSEIEVEVNGEMIKTTAPKAVSSDYMVLKSSPSLNVDKFVLKATNK